MNSNPVIPHRRSIRLAGYDYSCPGLYFVTLCVQGKAMLLGEASQAGIELSAAGQMVESWWKRLPTKFSGLLLRESVVMPNHVHGLLALTNCPAVGQPGIAEAPLPRVQPPPLSRAVRWFKTMTTSEYFRGVREAGWPAVAGKLWQRNYYEHIVRSPRASALIATYILENPSHWFADVENPNGRGSVPDPIQEIIREDR